MSLHLGDSFFCGMQIFSYCDLLFVPTIESYCSYCVPFVLLLPCVQKQKSNPTVPIAKSQLSFPLCPTGMSYYGPTEGGIQFCQRSQRSVGDQVTPSHAAVSTASIWISKFFLFPHPHSQKMDSSVSPWVQDADRTC